MQLKLTENEKIILLSAAYLFGLDLDKDDIIDFVNDFINDKKTCRSEVNKLIKKKMLIEQIGYYVKMCSISPSLLLPCFKILYQPENAGLLKKIEAEKEYRYKYYKDSDDSKWLIRAFTGKLRKTDQPSEQLIDSFTAVFDDSEFRDILLCINSESLAYILYYYLRRKLISDEQLDFDYLKSMIDERSKTDAAFYGNAMSILCNYEYLAHGTVSADIASLPVNEHSLTLVAMQRAYAGDYEQAYKLFTKAMTAHNKDVVNSNIKGIFENYAVNFIYLITMLLLSSDASLKKADTFCRRFNNTAIDYYVLIIQPLYDYFRKHVTSSVSASRVMLVLGNKNQHGAAWLSWLVNNRLGTWPAGTERPSLTRHEPQWAWLRTELMPEGIIPEAEKNNLLPEKSLFARVEIKAMWQLTLEQIITETGYDGKADKADNNTERAERLVYVLSYGEIDPILQKRRKNGMWTSGRHLNISSLSNVDEACLDDTDLKLIKSLRYSWDYNIYIGDYIDCLAGCDHVYADEELLMPVSIHEDKPYLTIDKKKDGTFTVKANPADMDEDNAKFYFIKNSETDYSVYHPTALEKKLYSQILSQPSYPAEAEPLLRKLIASVGGKMEIHSNMIVDSGTLEKVEAPTIVTVRCVPEAADSYSLTASVRISPTMVFVPGHGAKATVVERDGKRVQVLRKLKEERENMSKISDELETIGVTDIDEDTWSPENISDSVSLGVGDLLTFLDWVRDNKDVCEMEWPENARVKYHPTLGKSGISLNIKSNNGWFDVEGDVTIDDKQVMSLQRLLELMHASGSSKYIKIGDNEYLTLSKDLSKVLKKLDTVTTSRRGHMQMSTAAVGLIGDVLDDKDLHASRDKAVDEIRRRITESGKVEPLVPADLHAELRDYQEEGFEWMSRTTSWGAGVCLADDMGLGKTLQTITLLLEQKEAGPSLVVAPASVVPNWRNELMRFAPSLRVTMLNAADDRAEAVKEAGAGDVVVTTYALLNIQQDELTEKHWNVICLDEAHTIKNPNTKMSKAAMQLQARRKVELTGTPIQNHLSELWNLFQFINPGLLGSAEQFTAKYIQPIEADHDKTRQSQLKKLISPFLLRRTKGDVVDELPEKNEITVPVELSSDEMTMYEAQRMQAEAAVKSSKTVKLNMLAEITKLRQMACSCTLVDKNWKRTSSKVQTFIDLAESISDSGGRALVFSQFTSFLSEVRKAMDKASLPYLYLDGSTPIKQREEFVSEFQKGKCPFFIISLKAGGLGLNLTGANYVVHLDPWWNPAIEQQATDRAYRIGQRQDVTVYHLISQHTIEEKIVRLHKTKRDLADSLLEGADMSSSLTQEELLELLK